MLLALDTSTRFVSVAVHDEDLLASAAGVEPMRHGEQLAPLVDAVLEQAGAIRQDVTAVAVGVGPGPFTGLRVGVVTARVLGLALGVPVYGVCSLDVLAAGAVDEGAAEPFVATLDARRKELFWAVYDETGQRVDGPLVGRPADVTADLLVVGDGPVRYPSSFPRARGPETPDAATLARVVAEERAELLDAEPLYLRRPDATVPGPAKRVS